MLLQRLRETTGNMIAVIGLQGIGKTALREKLTEELTKNTKVYSLKWSSTPDNTLRNSIPNHRLHYAEAILNELQAQCGVDNSLNMTGRLLKRLGAEENKDLQQCLLGALRGEEESLSRIEMSYLSFFESTLNARTLKRIKDEVMKGALEQAATILIDLPDYDRTSISNMSNDLSTIQEWWNIYITSRTSLVIFFQKELFKGHFFMGKMDVVELTPFCPGDLVSFFVKKFGSATPFTAESLKEIAVLCRGIFRRFKKYVRICLEKAKYLEKGEVNSEDIRQWITIEQLQADMELELQTIFPKETLLRRTSVLVLRELRKNGGLTQRRLINDVFGGNSVTATRVLDKLEMYDYIIRERLGKEKLVKLKF
jgi:hypothetical protein